MISDYAKEKISFVKGRLNSIQNPELRGCLMDLFEEIESEGAFKGIKERAYCLGFTAGVSQGMDANNFMDAMAFLKPTYDVFKKSHDL
jgi:hypothetical protein